MFCSCGGILFVVRVEKAPESLPKHEQLVYDKVCDVQCHDCGKIYFSQPYDFMRKMNIVKEIN